MTEDTPSVPMAMPLKAAVAIYNVALNLSLIARLIKVWPVALTPPEPPSGPPKAASSSSPPPPER